MVRALLGVTPLGRVVQGALLGVYLGHALRDWHDRRGIRRDRLPPGVRRGSAPPGADAARGARGGGPDPRRAPERGLRASAASAPRAGGRGRSAPHPLHREHHRTARENEHRGARLRAVEARVPVRARGLRRAVGRRRDLQGHRAPRAARPRPRVLPPQGLLEGAARAGARLSRAGDLRGAGPAAGRAARALLPPPAGARGQGARGVRAARGRRGPPARAGAGARRAPDRPRPRSGDRSKAGCATSTTRACG